MRIDWTRVRHLHRDRRGAVIVIFALVLPILIGFVALAVEVGMWYMTQARMQEIADAAALAGVRELAAGTGKMGEAVAYAGTLDNCTAANNCSLGTPSTFTTASSSTVNGVQVTAQTTVNFLLAGAVMPASDNGAITISATGNADYTPGSNVDTGGVVGCVLALDNSAAYTVALENSAQINCAVMSDSKCSGPGSASCTLDKTTYGSFTYSSDDPQSGATLTTSTISSMLLQNSAAINSTAAAAGLITLNNSARVSTKIPNATQTADPYASLSLSVTPPSATAAVSPTGSGTSSSPYVYTVAANTCSSSVISVANSKYATFNPGCYAGISIGNSSTVTMNAGTYYIKGTAGSSPTGGLSISNSSNVTMGAGTYYIYGQLYIGNSATVTATGGTTLAMVGTGSASYGMTFGNSARLIITAPGPSSGQPYPGIALLGDPGATATTTQVFENSASLTIIGAAYFRTEIVDVENSATFNLTTCTQLIARRTLFGNSANLGTSCAGVGTSSFLAGQSVTTTAPTFNLTN